MKPMLPNGFSWKGNQIVVEAERGDGVPVRELVMIVADDELFATFQDELLNMLRDHMRRHAR